MSCEQTGHGTMSGKKRITVDESAWQSAQAAANRLRDVNAELPGMLAAVRRDGQAQIERATAELGSRQAAVEQSLGGLSAQTRKIEAATTRRIRDSTAKLMNELKDATAEIRATTRQALEEQDARLTEAIADEREQRERDVTELRSGFAEIRQDKARVLAAAGEAAANARLISQTIDEHLPHEQFAPGRLAALTGRLAQAEDNLGQGFGEAALGQAQDAYLELSQLRAEVEFRDQEWRAASSWPCRRPPRSTSRSASTQAAMCWTPTGRRSTA